MAPTSRSRSLAASFGAGGAGEHVTTSFTSGPLRGYMTSVCAVGDDPIVNHLFVIDGSSSPDVAHIAAHIAAHISDMDSVAGIGTGSPIPYILYSSASGGCRNVAQRRAIFSAAAAALSAPDAGVSSCVDCMPGFSDADSEPATPCLACAAGRYSAAVGATAAECSGVCSPGSHAAPASTAPTDCVDCVAGFVDHDSNPATICSACPTGRYADVAGVTACEEGGCSAGSYSPPGAASAAAAACVDCVPGYLDADADPSTQVK